MKVKYNIKPKARTFDRFDRWSNVVYRTDGKIATLPDLIDYFHFGMLNKWLDCRVYYRASENASYICPSIIIKNLGHASGI